MPSALRKHWPEYAIEALLLGTFMLVAAVATTLTEFPGSSFHRALPDAFTRRVVIGAAMGLTAAALIYSPWGRRSGAHMNPAITLAFHRLDKVEPWDAAFYIVAQFAGGVGGVLLAQALLGSAFTAPPVRDIATVPGPAGALAAFAGEFFISLTIYFVAPTLGMQAAIDAYRWATGRRHVICAKLAHDIEDAYCIFRCGHRPNLLRGRA